LSLSHLTPALLTQEVKADDKLCGVDETFNLNVRLGFFLNSLTDEQFVPEVSLLDLYKFSQTTIFNSTSQESQVRDLLGRLFDIESNFGWHEFEEFHPIFESLRRVLAPGPTSLSAAYPGARHNPAFTPSSITFSSVLDKKNFVPTFFASSTSFFYHTLCHPRPPRGNRFNYKSVFHPCLE